MPTTTVQAATDPSGSDPHGGGHDWRVAGEAWGHAANDWSCLYEHYATEVITAMLVGTGVGAGTSVLDVACGAGLGLRHAVGMGAVTAGIDASEELLDIARARVPDADLRLGSMFELPWAVDSFDVAISVNGIWGDCDDAVAEMHRVVRPGGMVAISYWGRDRPLDLRDCFMAFALHGPDSHKQGMRKTNLISRPGVAEEMLVGAGFEVVEVGRRISTVEWPDEETAWRALSSVGPALPALQHSDPEVVRRAVVSAIESCRDDRGIYRFRNDHRFVVARSVVRAPVR